MSKIELLKPSPISTSLYFDEKVVSVEGDGKTGTAKEGGRQVAREEGREGGMEAGRQGGRREEGREAGR